MIAIGTEEHLGLDLAEAVEHALNPKIGRTGRPGRAQRYRCQHGDNGFRHVRHETGDPVTLSNAQIFKGLRRAGDEVVKFPIGKAALYLILTPENDGIMIITPPQEVFGKVQAHIWIEGCTRHLCAIDQNGFARAFSDDTAVVPNGLPKGLDLRHRPVIKGRIIADIRTAARRKAGHKSRHIGARYMFCSWPP